MPENQSFSQIVYELLYNIVPFQSSSKSLDRNDVLERVKSTQVMHLVHLMTLCCIPLQEPHTRVRNTHDASPDPDEDDSNSVQPFISATELHEAGVKFKIINLDKPLLKIGFNRGVLEMPRLSLNEFTETFFRNLMAFEQYYLNTFEVTSYMYFMDHLVDTAKDVHILQKSNLLDNWLQSKENATAVFNTISKHTLTDFGPDLRQVSKEMKDYASRPWNKWKAKLCRDYFGTPWAIISFLAALVLLILTFIQTVATVRQAK